MKKKRLVYILLPFICAAGLAMQRGFFVHHSSRKNVQEIQQNIEKLEVLEQQTPVRSEKEDLTVKRKEIDLDEAKKKILALDAASVDKAKLIQLFRNTAIAGDSITAGCTEYGYLDDSIVFAKVGVSVSTAGELFQAVRAATSNTVFLCFGVNDIEAYESNVSRFIDHYTERIEGLQQAMPNADIYVQALLPPAESVTKSFYQYRDLYNEDLQKMCSTLDIQYVDPSFILEQTPELYDEDGVHPKKEFYPLWLTYFANIAGLSHEE
mgnify:FL=1